MSEQPSETVPESVPESIQEEFTVGDTKVVFKEEDAEYEEEQPMAVQPDARVGGDFWNEDNWIATGIGKTPEGNVLQVKKREGGSGYELSLRHGGVLPPLYTGWYTSYDKARDAGSEYLNTLEEKSA